MFPSPSFRRISTNKKTSRVAQGLCVEGRLREGPEGGQSFPRQVDYRRRYGSRPQGAGAGQTKDRRRRLRHAEETQESWHKVYTGYCVLNVSRQIVYQDVAETKVFIKDLTDEEIGRYIGTSEPFDKAGSYAVQGKGGYMVKEIKGSYTNVVGLPICEITEALLSLGILS